MGERKGQNKYYPPDFDPRKHRSLDAYHGSHPLRERARKLDQGILIIRFEMPYNIWCDGCGNHIGMGVRYNAEKSKIGMYYTTPIYKFRMKCHLCVNYMEIKTDPASHDYVIISGARRKEQRWDPKDNEQIVTDDKRDIKKMASDAMYKLEHGVDDKDKIKAAKPTIHRLTQMQYEKKDDYMLNKLARGKFREAKKMIKSAIDIDTDLLKKSSLDIKLVKEQEEDKHMATLLKYTTVTSYDEKEKIKREEIASQSIFHKSTDVPLTTGSTSSSNTSTCSSTDRTTDSKERAVTSLRKKIGLSVNKSKMPTLGLPNSTKSNKANNFGIVKHTKKTSDSKETCSRYSYDVKSKQILPSKICDTNSPHNLQSSVKHVDTASSNVQNFECTVNSLNSLQGDYGSSDNENSDT